MKDNQGYVRVSLRGNKIAVQDMRPEIAVVEVVGSAAAPGSLRALVDALEHVVDALDWPAGCDGEDAGWKRATTHSVSSHGVSGDGVWA